MGVVARQGPALLAWLQMKPPPAVFAMVGVRWVLAVPPLTQRRPRPALAVLQVAQQLLGWAPECPPLCARLLRDVSALELGASTTGDVPRQGG